MRQIEKFLDMGCRLISFAPPPPGAADIGYVSEAVWADDRFKLKSGRPSLQRVAPLQALIAEAEELELQAVAGVYQRRGEIDDFPIGRYLADIHRSQAETTLGELSGLDPKRLALDRALRNEVSRIRKRRTVFLVPDYWPPTLPLPKPNSPRKLKTHPVEKFLQSVAGELHAHLSLGTGTSSFGFLRLRRQAKVGARDRQPDELADHPGLMRSIMNRLLALASKDLGIGISAEGGFASGADVPEGPILFDGPTGSGKSLAASLLALSLGKEVVPVNVAGLTESILEGQMRGYVKGSFTGATQNEDGWFAKADGQVLFLDEFQNASLASQTQLLDLLDPFSDDVYVNRIGESGRTRYTVKVVIAVNKPVQELLATGVLREDLYYRIRKVVRFRPIAEVLMAKGGPAEKAKMIRRLVLLYRWKSSPYWQDPDPERGLLPQPGFPALFPKIDDDAIDLIATAPWKGNFRELERVVTDIHWKNDCRNSASIGIDEVQAELAKAAPWPSEGRRFSSSAQEKASAAGSAHKISNLVAGLCSKKTDVQAGDSRSWDRAYLEMVQELLIKNQFNIEGTVAALRPTRINLGSRQSLRAFLKENIEILRSEIINNEKIVKFIGAKNAVISD